MASTAFKKIANTYTLENKTDVMSFTVDLSWYEVVAMIVYFLVCPTTSLPLCIAIG